MILISSKQCHNFVGPPDSIWFCDKHVYCNDTCKSIVKQWSEWTTKQIARENGKKKFTDDTLQKWL